MLVILSTWIIFLSAIAFILWERINPYRKNMPLFREGFWMDLIWYTLIQSYFLKILIFNVIIANGATYFEGFQLRNHWPIWVQVLFFLLSHDLYIYWFHRLQHTNRWLWKTHEAHHSGKKIDWLSGSRSHIFEIIINQTIEFAPIIWLGASPEVVPIKATLDAVWGMFIHANIDVRLGKLKYIINSPMLHLWHHANHTEVFYANYGTKFAFWDYLFGTAYDPQEKKPVHWGLPYWFPQTYVVQQLHVFFQTKQEIQIFKTFEIQYQKVFDRLKNAIQTLFF